ncbi:TPA: DUF1642 domain-containing protein [Streptococcus suis]
MNKQEAIKRVEELYGYGSIAKTVTDIISQIHEPQKVVVPKFVAEWIEHCKQSNLDLDHAMRCTRVNNAETGVEEWIYENQETFARAWLFGYEIEQEKLYTVEIPDPNSRYTYRFLSKNDRGAFIDGSCDDCWKDYNRNHLTESEIKQDFEWAWQWAELVEVE